MKTNPLIVLLSAALGALCSYLLQLVIPLCVLVGVMLLDYITGMSKAWLNKDLDSKKGVRGILKKVGYLVVVCVAGVVDWLLIYGLHSIGIDAQLPFLFALIVTVWLIINELISILENTAAMGVPVPSFVTKLLNRLKDKVEEKADEEESDADD